MPDEINRTIAADVDTTLQAWQPIQRKSRGYGRIAVALIAVLCIACFVWGLWEPYQQKKLQFVLIAPNQPGKNQSADLEIRYDDILAEQLAASVNLFQVSAAWLHEINAVTTIEGGLHPANHSRVDEVLRRCRDNSQLPLVMLSGILQSTPSGSLLCDSERHADEGQGILVGDFLRRIDAIGAESVLVCIHPLLESLNWDSHVACFAAVEQLEQDIEQALSKARPSIATLTLLPPRTATQAAATPQHANPLQAVLRAVEKASESSAGSASTSERLQQALAMELPHAHWQANRSWELCSFALALPQLPPSPTSPEASPLAASLGPENVELSRPKFAATLVGMKAGSNTTAAKNTLEAWQSVDEYLQSAGMEQMLEFGWTLRDRWLAETTDAVPAVRPRVAPAAWAGLETLLVDTGRLRSTWSSSDLAWDTRQAMRSLAVLDHGRHESLPAIAKRWPKDSPEWAWRLASSNRFMDSITLHASASEELLAAQRLLSQQVAQEAELRKAMEAWTPTVRSVPEVQYAIAILSEQAIPWELRWDLQRVHRRVQRLEHMHWSGTETLPLMQSAARNESQATRIAMERWQADWADASRRLLNDTQQQIKVIEAYLLVHRQSVDCVTAFLRNWAHWDRSLLQLSDRSVENDAVCRATELALELAHVLTPATQTDLVDTASVVDRTGEMQALAQRLSDAQSEWTRTATTACLHPGQGDGEVDLAEWLNSPLPESVTRKRLTESSVLQRPYRSREQAWLRLARLESLVQLISMLARQTIPSELAQSLQQCQATLDDSATDLPAWSNQLGAMQLRMQTTLDRWSSAISSSDDLSTAELLAAALVGAPMKLSAASQGQIDQRLQDVAGRQRSDWIERRLVALQTESQVVHQRLRTALIAEHQLLATLPATRDQALSTPHRLQLSGIDEVVLTLKEQRFTTLSVHNPGSQAQSLECLVSYRGDEVRCNIEAPAGIEVTENPVGQILISGGIAAGQHLDLHLTVTQGQRYFQQSNIVVSLARRATNQNRTQHEQKHVISILGGRPPLVNCQLLHAGRSGHDLTNPRVTSASPRATLVASDLDANRVNPLSLHVTNLRDAAIQLDSHFWTLAPESKVRSIDEFPRSVLSKDEATAWMASQSLQPLTATPAAQAILPGETLQLKLPPLKHEPQTAPIRIETLVCAFQDTLTGDVQIVPWQPSVVRPSSLVDPTVSYVAETETFVVMAKPLGHDGQPATALQFDIQLRHRQSRAVLARGQMQLAVGMSKTETRLQLTEPIVGELLIEIAVNGWPSAFVFEAMAGQSRDVLPAIDGVAAVVLESQESSSIIPIARKSLLAQVQCIVPELHSALPAGQLLIGLDLNRDRLLRSGEPAYRLTESVSVLPTWQGVDPLGRLLVEPQVGWPTVTLPLPPQASGQIAVLATYEHPASHIFSQSLDFVVDRQPPSILQVAAVGGDHGLLGKPAEVRVEVDDAGGAGIVRVEGLWSTNGAALPHVDAKPTAAVKLQDDRWSLVLPTVNLRSGPTLLLVRAIDYAGNVGEFHGSFVDLRTEAERLAQQRAVTTVVQGQVKFGSIGLAQIQVALREISATAVDGETPVQLAPQSDAAILQINSDANGNFLIENVPSGKYELTASGLVRGMKMQRRTVIQVHAPQLPPPIRFRFDHPPETNDTQVATMGQPGGSQ